MSLPAWAELDARLPYLLERFGVALCSDEPVCDGEGWLHVTAAARVWNRERTHVLQVWSAKAGRFQFPGAHGNGDFDMEAVALREARRALGEGAGLRPLGASEILVETVAEYWNTPAHAHFAIVFEFWAEGVGELPKGARWTAADAPK